MITIVNRPQAVSHQAQVRSPQEIYSPGRIVRFLGRLYCVEWCNGTHVYLNDTMGSQELWMQVYPGINGWMPAQWTVPVDHIFLGVVEATVTKA